MCVTLCCPHCTGDACQWRCWCEHASRVRHVCCPLCLLSRITHVITLISTRPRSAASQCPASIPTIMFTSAVGPETWDHPATIFHVTAAFLYAILYSELCAYWKYCWKQKNPFCAAQYCDNRSSYQVIVDQDPREFHWLWLLRVWLSKWNFHVCRDPQLLNNTSTPLLLLCSLVAE